MRFESKEEREELIASFEAKAKELQSIKEQDAKRDPNYNCKVSFDHRSEFDEVTYKEGTDEIVQCKGDIYVFYIHQPKLLDTIKILQAKDGIYTQSLIAWSAMIDEKESSPEIKQDRIKLGYLLKMLNHIDALLSDGKKN